MKPGRDLSRIMRRVEKTDSCWLFTGAKTRGYGSVRFKSRSYLAHRAIFELMVGAIPPGMDLCHRCDVRNCVNPGHLFIGTRSENMVDCVTKGRHKPTRWKAVLTHCPAGHAYSGENLITDSNGWRRCKVCSYRRRMRYYYAKGR